MIFHTAAVALALLASPEGRALPAEFHHDRIYLLATAPDSSSLRLYTDSGGGWNSIRRSTRDRLGLAIVDSLETDGGKVPMVEFPAFLEQAAIPAPFVESWLEGRLVVEEDQQLAQVSFMDTPRCDGFLGTRWFAGRVWEFDYPGRTLRLLGDWTPSAGDRPALLGFRSDSLGKRDQNFPRITVTIDGQVLEMLLDTGANAKLTASSATVFGLAPGDLIGISYITKSTLESWAKRHPDWRVIEKGEGITGRELPMIEVPEVLIAGLPVGPVWFAERSDRTFREWMSGMMDRQIEGAIGGSALKYLRFVLDYPGSVAYFSPRDSLGRSR